MKINEEITYDGETFKPIVKLFEILYSDKEYLKRMQDKNKMCLYEDKYETYYGVKDAVYLVYDYTFHWWHDGESKTGLLVKEMPILLKHLKDWGLLTE